MQAYSAKMSRQPLTPTKRSGVASSGTKYKDIGAAAFGFVGQDRRNKLPEEGGSAPLNIFKGDLKTHLFINTF